MIPLFIFKEYNMLKNILVCTLFVLSFFSCSQVEVLPENPTAKAVEKTNTDTKVWVHFMLWYETPESTGWGQHWYKGGEIPAIVDGVWKNLYTRYPPLTGPYPSGDENILEYQLLLMKYSGIDGVIPDWYGISDQGSSEDKTANMSALFRMVKKVGLKMAVCYEDRFKSSNEAIATTDVKEDLQYLRTNYLNSSSYLKIDDAPVLFIFGPIQWTSYTFWQNCFSVLSKYPAFFTLYAHNVNFVVKGVSYGQYNWPNNSPYQNQYTQLMNSGQKECVVGAWPGFKDCYTGTAVDDIPQYTVTEHRGGLELEEQLNYALTQKPKYLQIATWNDYGEGTMIEPTYEFGYTFLEKVQAFTGVSYNKANLESIKRLYDLRVAFANNQTAQKKLDDAFDYFNALQPDKAVEFMNELAPQ